MIVKTFLIWPLTHKAAEYKTNIVSIFIQARHGKCITVIDIFSGPYP